MEYEFPSEEWVSAYKDAVNANEGYRKAGKDWTFGAVAMVVEADASIGIEKAIGMILDVHEGVCRGTKYVLGIDGVESAPFIIVGSYDRWKEVVEGKSDPIKAMMQGKLKLQKGHLPTILRFVESNRQLVVSATHVATRFKK